jgi:hypothetical protein
MKKKYFLSSVCIFFGLSACVSSGVIPIDKGIYMITSRSSQIGTGEPVGTTADVYKEASAYCGSLRKDLETVELKTTPSRLASPGNVSLQFRCIPK